MAFGRINGTAAHFAGQATAQSQSSAKNPHGPNSPIWMRRGQILYNQSVEESANKYEDCATAFFSSGFTMVPAGCDIQPLGEPWSISIQLAAINDAGQLLHSIGKVISDQLQPAPLGNVIVDGHAGTTGRFAQLPPNAQAFKAMSMAGVAGEAQLAGVTQDGTLWTPSDTQMGRGRPLESLSLMGMPEPPGRLRNCPRMRKPSRPCRWPESPVNRNSPVLPRTEGCGTPSGTQIRRGRPLETLSLMGMLEPPDRLRNYLRTLKPSRRCRPPRSPGNCTSSALQTTGRCGTPSGTQIHRGRPLETLSSMATLEPSGYLRNCPRMPEPSRPSR